MQHNNEPVVTMVTLGRNGRFGNQIFQYAFIKIYAKKFNLKIETPEWIGQYLFGQYDTHITNQLPTVFEHEQKNFSHVLTESQPRFVNVDFWGYFQFNARYYAPHKEYFYHLFKPVDEIEKTMQTALKALRSRGKTLVALHLRRGDYLSIQGRVFYAAPVSWYKDWLDTIWSQLDKPVLFIASDDIKCVLPDFQKFNPCTSNDIIGDFPKASFPLI